LPARSRAAAAGEQARKEPDSVSPNVVNGLPAHVLLVHAVVVLIPLTAVVLVACAVWPPLARRLGLLLPVLGVVALGFVPLTTQAGEWLESRVDESGLVRRHAELGDGLLPWAIGLCALSVVVWWTARRWRPAAGGEGEGTGASAGRGAMVVRVAAAVLSLAVAVGAVVDVYRVGDSGAKAAWHDSFSQTPLHS
jgi:hypothetical protein